MADDEIGLSVSRKIPLDHSAGIDLARLTVAGVRNLLLHKVIRCPRSGMGFAGHKGKNDNSE